MASDRYEELRPCLKRLEELEEKQREEGEEDYENGESLSNGRRKKADGGGVPGGMRRFLR